MKLLFCKNCMSLFNLSHETKTCTCGKAAGHYLTKASGEQDTLNAIYWGDGAVPVGFSNPEFVEALKHQPKSGWGKSFAAFIIPQRCDTFVKLNTDNPNECRVCAYYHSDDPDNCAGCVHYRI